MKPDNIIYTQTIPTPLGPMLAGMVSGRLSLLDFTDSSSLPSKIKNLSMMLNAEVVEEKTQFFEMTALQLQEYFDGKRKIFDLPITAPGTDFQQKVWNSLLEIRYGTTCTYQQQSISLHMPLGIRAIAKANGLNRIAIIIPCHRVIGKDGALTGYAGGLQRKKWLLDFEYNNKENRKQLDLFLPSYTPSV